MISLHEVNAIHKAKTVAIFPNAIEIVAGGTKVTNCWIIKFSAPHYFSICAITLTS